MSAEVAMAYRLLITGRVQGVGYRDAMIGAACNLGLVGWIRNRRDGSVEAWVQGSGAEVDRIVAWSRRGPPAAIVAKVAIEEVIVDPALAEFEFRPTL